MSEEKPSLYALFRMTGLPEDQYDDWSNGFTNNKFYHQWMKSFMKVPNFLLIPNMVDRADAVAEFYHSGQFRFDGKTPYITHPRAVAALLHDPREKQVALLHDLLEDTDCTRDDLLSFGFSTEVIEAVEVMTKVEGVDYTAYLVRVKSNVLARKVKEKDMLINLSDEPTRNQVKKYSKGLIYLLS